MYTWWGVGGRTGRKREDFCGETKIKLLNRKREIDGKSKQTNERSQKELQNIEIPWCSNSTSSFQHQKCVMRH